MHGIKVANPLEEISALPEWKIPKLGDFTLGRYLSTLKNEEDALRAKLEWIHAWKSDLQREQDKRKSAAAEVQRRKERDERQAKEIEERNARLEMEYHRDTHAE